MGMAIFSALFMSYFKMGYRYKFSGLSIAMSIKSLMDYSGLFLFFWLIMDEHLHSTVAVLELNVNIKQSKSNMSVIFCKYAAVFFTLNYVM